MKNLFLLIFVVSFISCGGQAQVKEEPKKATTATTTKTAVSKTRPATPAAQGDYKAKNEGWSVNLEEAYAESKKTGKPIMANFTGSDWCGWCKRLDKSVFHQPGFKAWADKNVVLLEVDFPRRFKVPTDVAKQNQNLQRSFGVRGYPSIWVFDTEKDETGKFNFQALGKTGYTKTLKEFQTTIEKYISMRK